MLFEIFSLILYFAVGVVASACLLRAYAHALRINISPRSGNPIAPFLFAMTNWIVLPTRRFVSAFGRVDTASLGAAYALVLAKHVLLWLLAGAVASSGLLFIKAGFELLNLALSSLMWLTIFYALMSWMRTVTSLMYFIEQLVEPLLRPIRRLLPLLGGVDLSPLVLVLLIQIAEIVLHSALN